jgi:hypothetical protein
VISETDGEILSFLGNAGARPATGKRINQTNVLPLTDCAAGRKSRTDFNKRRAAGRRSFFLTHFQVRENVESGTFRIVSSDY